MINKQDVFHIFLEVIGQNSFKAAGQVKQCLNFNQSESVNSFFLLFLQNLMISGKSIIGKERGQGGGKLCKIEQSLDF